MSSAVAPSPGVTLTDQQRRALGVPDASVALSAGAGCGKTMVLTERFLAALDDGRRPAARGPGRPDVHREGGPRAAAADPRPVPGQAGRRRRPDRDRWWAVLRGLDAAPIGTFHEFCARLLRRHALQAGVDPEFAILDESIAGSLRDEAVRTALRKLLAARDADLIDLGTDYGLRQVREALGRLATLRGAVGLEEWAAAGARGDRRALARPRRRPALADGARPAAAPGRALPTRCSRRSTPT